MPRTLLALALAVLLISFILVQPTAAGGGDNRDFFHRHTQIPPVMHFSDFPCRNGSYSLKDLTVVVFSASAVVARRLPPLRDTWLKEIQQAGGRVVVVTGSAVPPIEGLEMQVASTVEVGAKGCAGKPHGHCRQMLHEQLGWMGSAITSRLIMHADDDTVVNVTSLAAALRCMPTGAKWMLGDCKYDFGTLHYCTGGASVIFQKRLVAMMLRHCVAPAIADDVSLSICAALAGAHIVSHPGFSYDPRKSGDDWVSVHHVKPKNVKLYLSTTRLATHPPPGGSEQKEETFPEATKETNNLPEGDNSTRTSSAR